MYRQSFKFTPFFTTRRTKGGWVCEYTENGEDFISGREAFSTQRDAEEAFHRVNKYGRVLVHPYIGYMGIIKVGDYYLPCRIRMNQKRQIVDAWRAEGRRAALIRSRKHARKWGIPFLPNLYKIPTSITNVYDQ